MPSNDTFTVRDNRGPKYLKIYNDFYDRFGATLGPFGLAVYVALCRYIDVNDSDCNPSYATIARGTGMSRRKVIDVVKQLKLLRIIAIEQTPYKPNVFILLDTSAPYAPQTSAPHAPPSARRAPKQESTNNTSHRHSNKKVEQRYSDFTTHPTFIDTD
jgi:hypothetical protein